MNIQEKNNIQHTKLCFFGSPQIAVWVLDELKRTGIAPALIVTNPDARQGRNMILTPTPVACWGDEHHVPVIKPESLHGEHVEQLLKNSGCELFVVAAYGKLIPEAILNIPKYKTINMHPSLLPKLRGASPIRSAILEDMNPTGVSVMILTKGMDEGPLLAQREVSIQKEEWPLPGNLLDERLAREGGALLSAVLPNWVSGDSIPVEQNHSEATYSTKITKEMGELNLKDSPYHNLLKIRAFDGWPGTFFFVEKNGTRTRIKVLDAEITKDGLLHITRVIPEGRHAMDYDTYIKSMQ